MAQDKHVTSDGIDHLADRVDRVVRPLFTSLRDAITETNISAPGFGLVGDLVLAEAYKNCQAQAWDFLDGIDKTVLGWTSDLRVCSHNWRLAEDANMTVTV